jgi:hypothetical protein
MAITNDQADQALTILRVAVAAAQADPEACQRGQYRDSMLNIDLAERFFFEAVQGLLLVDTPNEGYHGFAQAVTKLLILSSEYPDTFNLLMKNICEGRPLASYAGLISTHWFLHALMDDHNYVLEEGPDGVTITVNDGYLLGPASLLRHLSKLV